jgi:hypothetical protein
MDAVDHPTNPSFPTYEQRMRSGWLSTVVRNEGRYDESCVAAHPNDSWRCGDLAHVAEHHITTPFFVRTDLIDPNVLDNFGTPDWPFGTTLWEFGAATWDHLDRTSRARALAEEKAEIAIDPGLYGPLCGNHTALRDNAKFYADKVAKGGSGFTFHDTLRSWLIGGTPSLVLETRPSSDPPAKSAVCTP